MTTAVPWRRSVDPTSPTYRWLSLAVTSLGALLASLTSGTLIITSRDIARDLHTDRFAARARGGHRSREEAPAVASVATEELAAELVIEDAEAGAYV